MTVEHLIEVLKKFDKKEKGVIIDLTDCSY